MYLINMGMDPMRVRSVSFIALLLGLEPGWPSERVYRETFLRGYPVSRYYIVLCKNELDFCCVDQTCQDFRETEPAQLM